MRFFSVPGRILLVLATCLLAVLHPPPAAAVGALPRPGGWPVAGTPKVVRGFDPPQVRWAAGHRGVDLAAEVGEPVLASAAGRVHFAGTIAGRPVVSIDHGAVRTTYEPVEPVVVEGQSVVLGQLIGRVARGGHCSGNCLHWGLREGESYLNPLLLIRGGDSRVRLLAEDHRADVIREARARAVAAARAAEIGFFAAPRDSPGRHSFSRPVPGPVTSPFGMRFHPVLHRWKLHDGTDFGAACGTPIRAPADGRVTRRYHNAGYGNRLIIEHGTVDGRSVRTAYNHATRYVVSPGDRVRGGEVIGYVGSTGFSTGCHLHLMVWLDGNLVNPMTWF